MWSPAWSWAARASTRSWWTGPGATVPLTGFGYLLAKGVRKAVEEQGFLGALTGGVTAAAGGITAAIFFGFLVALLFKSKPKS